MSKWADRVQNHPVRGTVSSAMQLISELTASQLSQGPDDIARVKWVLENFEKRAEGASPYEVAPGVLDQSNSYFQAIVNELSNFRSTGNVGHIQNINAHVDSVLPLLATLPPLTKRGAAAAINAQIRATQGIVSAVEKSADEKVEELKRKVDEVAGTILEISERANTLVIEAKQEKEEALAQIAAERSDQEVVRAESVKKLDLVVSEFQTESADELIRLEGEFRDAVSRIDAESDQLITHLTRLKGEADELVGAIGITGVAGGYNETAIREGKAAGAWRIATVAAAVVAILVLFYAAFFTHTTSVNWEQLATRVLISISLGGLAAYCGRQSSEHRREQRRARANQLQLAALNPYLANLPDDESVRLKVSLAPGYFSPNELNADRRAVESLIQNSGLSLKQLTALLEQLGNAAKAIATKGADDLS